MLDKITTPIKKVLPYTLKIFELMALLFLILALIGYNPMDPSYNRAAPGHASNMAGEFAAYIADPILQLFGFSFAVAIFVMLQWNIKFFIRHSRRFGLLRFISLALAIASLSVILASIGTPEMLPFNIGGVVGNMLFDYVNSSFFSGIMLQAAAVVIFIIALFFALNIKHWQVIRSLIVGLTYYIRYGSYSLFETVAGKFNKAETTSISKKSKLKKVKDKAIKKNKFIPAIIPSEFELPNTEFLRAADKMRKNSISQAVLDENKEKLMSVLADFGVKGEIINVSPGPVVTLYELEPAAGTKSSRVIGLADDIARSMSALSARIAVIPGRNAIGIELPNPSRETVYLRSLLESKEYQSTEQKLPIVLGKDIAGNPVVADLAKMPHLLVAGTTGSGKSVAINTMIMSLLYKLTPEQCKFIMIDPKMLELSVYEGIPHLLTPVVTEPGKAVTALKWVTKEMESRYRAMSNLGVRNIANYNEKIMEACISGTELEQSVQTGFDPDTGKPVYEKIAIEKKPLPFIVVIVDEMADLMLVAGKDIETSVQRLAQMARAAGIHIIMATQRPSVDVITGVIKANFPTRISFQVTSRIDSRTILGEQGAEQLLGMGDMLYMAGGSRITRVHGPFVSDDEVRQIVDYLKLQGSPAYIEEVTADDGDNFSEGGSLNAGADVSDKESDLYQKAVEIVLRDKKPSISYVQRALRIGYNRAAIMIERMEKEGIVSEPNHSGKREIL